MENKTITAANPAAATVLNALEDHIGTFEAVTDTFEAISDYIYKKLMIVRESPEDYSQDTADLLADINNKVYRLCERGKAEAALASRSNRL